MAIDASFAGVHRRRASVAARPVLVARAHRRCIRRRRGACVAGPRRHSRSDPALEDGDPIGRERSVGGIGRAWSFMRAMQSSAIVFEGSSSDGAARSAASKRRFLAPPARGSPWQLEHESARSADLVV